jgi:putative lipoic acid-binding regulatory protein
MDCMDRNDAAALLDAHHTFPSDHRFQVIVRSNPDDIGAVLAALARHFLLPNLDGRVEKIPSRQGTYVSLRLLLPCQSAFSVLDTYALLGSHPSVIRCI